MEYAARETIFSFSERPQKMVFPKKLRWNIILLILSAKMIFPFPENMILHLRQKIKVIFLKKYMKIWYFLQTLWKDGLFKKGSAGTWSFSIIWEDGIFSQKHDLFSLGRKWKTAFPKKYMETWCIAQRRKTGNLVHRIEAWLILKFIRLEIFYN